MYVRKYCRPLPQALTGAIRADELLFRPSATTFNAWCWNPALKCRLICLWKLLSISSGLDFVKDAPRHKVAMPLFTGLEWGELYGSTALLSEVLRPAVGCQSKIEVLN